MSVPVLEAIADAIYDYEGNKPHQRAYRNRNPGNLRPTGNDQQEDAEGYRIFSRFADGYDALLADLAAKATGKNPHGLNFDSSLFDLFKVYAPAGDRNAPDRYAIFVAGWLSSVYTQQQISPLMSFRHLYKVSGEAVPFGVPPA